MNFSLARGEGDFFVDFGGKFSTQGVMLLTEQPIQHINLADTIIIGVRHFFALIEKNPHIQMPSAN